MGLLFSCILEEKWNKNTKNISTCNGAHTSNLPPQNTKRKYFSAQCSSNPRRALLLGSFQTSSACPSGKTNKKMGMEHWWNDNDKEKTKVLGGKKGPCATLTTTNLTRTNQGLNPGLRGTRLATNRLRHGTD
jgi:hypothetical protein